MLISLQLREPKPRQVCQRVAGAAGAAAMTLPAGDRQGQSRTSPTRDGEGCQRGCVLQAAALPASPWPEACLRHAFSSRTRSQASTSPPTTGPRPCRSRIAPERGAGKGRGMRVGNTRQPDARADARATHRRCPRRHGCHAGGDLEIRRPNRRSAVGQRVNVVTGLRSNADRNGARERHQNARSTTSSLLTRTSPLN